MSRSLIWLLAVLIALFAFVARWLWQAPSAGGGDLVPRIAAAAPAPARRAPASDSIASAPSTSAVDPAPKGRSASAGALLDTPPSERTNLPVTPTEFTLTGLCRDEFDAVVADVQVSAVLVQRVPGAPEIPGYGPNVELVETAVATDASGHFELTFPIAPEPNSLRITWQSEGKLSRIGELSFRQAPVGDLTADLGTVRLFPGAKWSARAVDELNFGIGFERIELDAKAEFGDPRVRWQPSMAQATSPQPLEGLGVWRLDPMGLEHISLSVDANGDLPPSDLPIGKWTLTSRSKTHDLIGPLEIDLAPGATLNSVLRFQSRAIIAGELVGPQALTSSARIQAVDLETGEDEPRPGAPNQIVPTDSNGAFAFYRKRGGADRVWISVAEDQAVKSVDPVIATWGEHVRLPVIVRPSLTIQAVDADTAAALQSFVVLLSYEDSDLGQSAFFDHELDKAKPSFGDSVTLEGLDSTPQRLYVFAPDGYASVGPLELMPRDNPYEIPLRRLEPFAVKVLDANEQPVTDAEVQLLGVFDQEFDPALPHAWADQPFFGQPAETPTIWKQSQTNELGHARLPSADLTEWDLFVYASSPTQGSGWTPVIRTEGALVVRLHSFPSVMVELRGDWPIERAYISLRHAQTGALLYPTHLGKLPPPNTITFEQVPAAKWELIVGLDIAIGQPIPIETDGVTPQTIALDAGDVLSPPTQIRVEIDGQPAPSGKIKLTLWRLAFGDTKIGTIREYRMTDGVVSLPLMPRDVFEVELVGKENVTGTLDLTQPDVDVLRLTTAE